MNHKYSYMRLYWESREEPQKLKIHHQWEKLSVITTILVVLGLTWPLWHYFGSKHNGYDGMVMLAKTRNGTYAGLYNDKYRHYQFLGIPYATPPLGPLRFRAAIPSNNSWVGVRAADEYGPMCNGYGDYPEQYPQSEDCLTVNVLSPRRKERGQPLPVAVWIYGGAGHGGGSRDGRYNLSYIVSHAVRHDMPFIAVSFNYRSSLWGFITGREVLGTGHSNIGLRDQRMVLHWVQENIAAFGGDPRMVTLWGASSGADDVGLHLTAYGGRDDGLFRAAILQSGTALARTAYRTAPVQSAYDALIASAACSDTEDTLECLRQVPVDELKALFDDGSGGESANMIPLALPAIDGNFVQTYGSQSIKQMNFVKVPIIIGAVSHEGFDWINPELQNKRDVATYLRESYRRYPASVADRLTSYYSATQQPTESESQLWPPIKGITNASLFRQAEEVLGDLEINAARRLMCDAYSRAATCYSYRWDAVDSLSSNNPIEIVVHGAEIGPVLQNIKGIGFQYNPFEGRGQGYFELTSIVGLMWVGFITKLDPNAGVSDSVAPVWPKYTAKKPLNVVFNETGPYWIEADVARRQATDYINSFQHGILDR